jgi:chromate transporter
MKDLNAAAAPDACAPSAPRYTLWQLVRYMLRLGTLGFGGPVALVGYMYRDLVEQRHWISDADYKEGLALAQLMPGPLAAQLAIYLGYIHFRLWGATLAGMAFVLPSFVMVVALGVVYKAYGGISWMQAVFYGVGASVIGIIALSAYKLTTKSVGKDRLLGVIYLVSATVTIVTQSEVIWVFLGAGVLVWAVRGPLKRTGGQLHSVAWLAPVAGALSLENLDWHKLGQIATYFTYAGAFVFGSGLAIVPFLYGGVVKEYAWLTDRQFVDAVAVAMITPGPVVITTGFIGFLTSGFWGAVVAAAATFLPCYLLTVIPAPYFKRHGKHPGVVAFVDGVTAAAVGAIAGAVVVLGQRSVVDLPTAALFLASTAVLWRFKKLPEPVVVLAAALIGLAVYPLVGHL